MADPKLYHDFLRDALREKFSGRSAPDVSAAVLRRLNSPARPAQRSPGEVGKGGAEAPIIAMHPWRTRAFALVAAALLLAVASVVVWFVVFNNTPARPVDTAERKDAPPPPAPTPKETPRETPAVKDTPKVAPKEPAKETPKDTPKQPVTPEGPPVTPTPSPEKPPVQPEQPPVQPETPREPERHAVVEVPGARKSESSGVLTLERGCFVLQKDAPKTFIAGAAIEHVTGRVAVAVGGVPADDTLKDVVTVMESPDPLTSEEKTMLLNRTNWLLKTGFALCVLSGTVMLDGATIDAQRRAVPVGPEKPKEAPPEKPADPEQPPPSPEKPPAEPELSEAARGIVDAALKLGNEDCFRFLRAAKDREVQRKMQLDAKVLKAYRQSVGTEGEGVARVGRWQDKDGGYVNCDYFCFSTGTPSHEMVQLYFGYNTLCPAGVNGYDIPDSAGHIAELGAQNPHGVTLSSCPGEMCATYKDFKEARGKLGEMSRANEDNPNSGLKPKIGTTYVLRHLLKDGPDVLVAFKVLALDTAADNDKSVVIAWKLVHTFSLISDDGGHIRWAGDPLVTALLDLSEMEHAKVMQQVESGLVQRIIGQMPAGTADEGSAILVPLHITYEGSNFSFSPAMYGGNGAVRADCSHNGKGENIFRFDSPAGMLVQLSDANQPLPAEMTAAYDDDDYAVAMRNAETAMRSRIDHARADKKDLGYTTSATAQVGATYVVRFNTINVEYVTDSEGRRHTVEKRLDRLVSFTVSAMDKRTVTITWNTMRTFEHQPSKKK